MEDHPQHFIIRDSTKKVTRSSLRYLCNHLSFFLQVEPKKVQEALVDDYQVKAMHEELIHCKRNNVQTLVPKSNDHSIIGSRWDFRSKLDENGLIIRNKDKLVAKGYNQEEGIDLRLMPPLFG